MSSQDLTASVSALGDRAYSESQVCHLLGKSRQQVRTMRKNGMIQWARNGGHLEYSADQVDQMTKKQWFVGPASAPRRVR